MSSQTMAIRTVGAGLALGSLATFLTFEHQLGLGVTLLGVALLSGLVIFARLHDIRPISRNLVLLLPALFFSGMIMVRSDWLLTTMNVGAAIVATLLLVYYFRSGNVLKVGVLDYPLKAMLSGIAICAQPFQEMLGSKQWLAAHREKWPAVGPLVRGGAITVPVVGVFIILLSAADEVFARLVHDVMSAFSLQNASGIPLQVSYTLLFAWAVIGGLGVSLIERKVKRAPPQTDGVPEPCEEELVAKAPARRVTLGFTETVMLLGSICTLFAAFVMIQFVYLFGGTHNIADYTYASYVHRGFLELVIVALLTLAIALTLNTITIRRTPVQVNIVRGLSTVLILLTGVILVSAFQRLRLYELAYGFTSLRLLIYVFIGWLGFTFLGFVLSLYWQPRSVNVFATTMLIAAFGFAATLDIVNPDYFVAWQNINRGDIDPLHFSQLSEEAIPALVTLVNAPEPGLRDIVRYTLAAYRYRLPPDYGDWRDFNVDRSVARDALKTVGGLDSPKYQVLRVDDFKNLHFGMTVREIARQFGFPYFSSGADIYGEYSTRDNRLSLSYRLDDGRFVELQFDATAGLNAAIVCEKPPHADQCTSLFLAR